MQRNSFGLGFLAQFLVDQAPSSIGNSSYSSHFLHIMHGIFTNTIIHRDVTQIEAPLAETEELISCSVKLSGSSVAQGLKQCVLSGAVGLPLPGVLTALTSSASNSVLVQEGCLVGHTHSPADNDENQHNRT